MANKIELNYATPDRTPRRSKLAVSLLPLGMFGSPLAFVLTYSDIHPHPFLNNVAFVIPPLLTLALGPIALVRIRKSKGLLRGIPLAIFGMVWAILYISIPLASPL